MLQKRGNESATIDSAVDFSDIGFLYRKNVQELCDFAVKQLAAAEDQTAYVSAKEPKIEQCLFHKFRKDNSIAIIVVDAAYPSRAAFNILRELMTEYDSTNGNFPNGQSKVIHKGITEYQDPNNADKLAKIQANLDETKDIMVQNLEKAIGRGESLNEMLEKSENISAQSKLFADKAEDLNRCCSVI